jgi:filamentous hemagglutinin family protein
MESFPRYSLVIMASLFGGLLYWPPGSFAQTPITSSGLNTQVSGPSVGGGQTQFNITGGTRPGNGTNLFHSFGTFNVPDANIANFLNETGLPTSNILGRVNGGNVSNIFGTIQTTGFGNANLFLMNPAGFLFGPNATVNVGGMVSFTAADYLRLTDNARFNAVPSPADALLTAAPVAAFGFLRSNPGAITVQGSQLTVAEETGISLVGGNITVEGGTLTAGRGQINLVSVGRPTKPNIGGEVVIAGSGHEAGFTPTGFRTLGTVSLSQGSTINVGGTGSPSAAGSVVIRGGQFVMDEATITAASTSVPNGGSISVESTGDLDVRDSRLSTRSTGGSGGGGPIDLKAGASIILTDTIIDTLGLGIHDAGSITMAAPIISLSGSLVSVSDDGGRGGIMNLTATKSVSLSNGTYLSAESQAFDGIAGTILINGGNLFSAQQSTVTAAGGLGGTIQVQANRIVLTDSEVTTLAFTQGGHITMDAKQMTLKNSKIDSSAFGSFPIPGDGGTITITSPSFHQDTNSVIDASSQFGTNGTVTINGVVQP